VRESAKAVDALHGEGSAAKVHKPNRRAPPMRDTFMPDKQLVDIAAELRHETLKAFLIFDGGTEVWVPKSLVENNGDGTFTMPEWLAKKLELI
jgi:hypothetical protein